MREDISFRSERETCRGWFYIDADDNGGPLPSIAMAHGFSGVKEMDLPLFAERFCG
jgi:hypothetical protein